MRINPALAAAARVSARTFAPCPSTKSRALSPQQCPISDFAVSQFAANERRRFERLLHPPHGFLALAMLSSFDMCPGRPRALWVVITPGIPFAEHHQPAGAQSWTRTNRWLQLGTAVS